MPYAFFRSSTPRSARRTSPPPMVASKLLQRQLTPSPKRLHRQLLRLRFPLIEACGSASGVPKLPWVPSSSAPSSPCSQASSPTTISPKHVPACLRRHLLRRSICFAESALFLSSLLPQNKATATCLPATARQETAGRRPAAARGREEGGRRLTSTASVYCRHKHSKKAHKTRIINLRGIRSEPDQARN